MRCQNFAGLSADPTWSKIRLDYPFPGRNIAMPSPLLSMTRLAEHTPGVFLHSPWWGFRLGCWTAERAARQKRFCLMSSNTSSDIWFVRPFRIHCMSPLPNFPHIAAISSTDTRAAGRCIRCIHSRSPRLSPRYYQDSCTIAFLREILQESQWHDESRLVQGTVSRNWLRRSHNDPLVRSLLHHLRSPEVRSA